MNSTLLFRDNKIKMLLSALLITLVMLCIPSMSASAADPKAELSSSDTLSDKTAINAGTKDVRSGETLAATDQIFVLSDKAVTLNETNFNKLSSSGQRDALKELMDRLDKNKVSQQGQQQVIDMVRASNPSAGAVMVSLSMSSTKADMFTALKWLEPFMPIVNFVLGVLVMGIFILLILSTTIDLAYIGLPFARNMGDNNQKDNGKVPFVTWDAQSVVKEVESSIGGDGGYKNPYLIYLKRRVLTYIILAFCILYLVAGDLGTLIGWLLSLGSGIVGN